jgi:hypothetical protein
MPENVTKLVEYQDKQFTPKEALEYLLEHYGDEIERINIFYVKDETIHSLFGSRTRDYTNEAILWDLTLFRKAWIDSVMEG